MMWLILGLALWSGVHLVKPLAPALRTRLGERLGEGIWMLVVVVLLVLSIWLMAIGYGRASAEALWIAPLWLRHLTVALMVPAFMLFTATYPGSWLKARIRHPQLIGFKLWAALHLAVNGDVRSLVLFGGILVWAVVALIAIDRRDGKPPLPPADGNPLRAWAFVPSGLVVWAVVFWAHGALFGVYPLT